MDFDRDASVKLKNGQFTDGNPATAEPASLVTAKILNAIGNEIINVQAVANLVANIANHTQLNEAIDWKIANQAVAPGSVRGYDMANAVDDPDHDLDIDAGSITSADGTTRLVLAAPLRKRLDAAWAKGDTNGGLFAGAIAATTTYHVFAIREDATGDIDAGFDTDIDAANRPAGWTQYARLGARLTDATSLLPECHQFGDYVFYDDDVLDVSLGAQIAGAVNQVTVSVPTGVRVLGIFGMVITGTSPSGADARLMIPGSLSGGFEVGVQNAQNLGGIRIGAMVLTDTAGRVDIKNTNAIDSLALNTIGWLDRRG